MLENSGSPIIGRLASAGFGFLLSVAGLPVAESIGSRSQTITPQMPPPHLLTRTLASPCWVSQTPEGSRACARAGPAANNAAKTTPNTAPTTASLQAMTNPPEKGRSQYQQIRFVQCRRF